MKKILLSLMMVMASTVASYASFTVTTPDPDDGVTVIVTTDNYGQLPNNFNSDDWGQDAFNLLNGGNRTKIQFVGKFSSNDLNKFNNDPLNKYSTVDFSQAEFENNTQSFSPWKDHLTTAILSEKVTSFNDGIFSGCKSVTSVNYKSMTATVEKGSDNKYTITYTKSGNTDDDTYFESVLRKVCDQNDLKELIANVPAAQTAFENGTLTLAAGDDTAERLAVIVASSDYANGAENVNKVIFPDGSVWERTAGGGKLTTTQSPDTHAAALDGAGLPVTETVSQQNIGKYVSIVNGKTILTIPEGETDVLNSTLQSSKLSQTEKDILLSTDNLTIVGTMTENDWTGLTTQLQTNGQCAITSLDLSQAIVPSNKQLGTTSLGKSIQNLTLPNNWTYVPAQFCYQCRSLRNVVFSDNITEIKEKAFFDCDALATVDLPSNLTTIGNEAFSNSGLTELELPSKLTNVGASAFFKCPRLENVKMEMLEGDCTFGEYAFASCTSLKHITLSEGVTNISAHMFDQCSLLESVRIPTTVADIYDYAFNLCAGLHKIIIPEYSRQGRQQIHSKVFENSGLTDIYVMAESYDKVPEILSIKSNGKGGENSTFLKAQTISNTADPSKGHRGDASEPASILNPNNTDEDILTWYQEEMSPAGYGVGGGDCLVVLHFPESMKNFYDGKNNPLNGDGPDVWLNAQTESPMDNADYRNQKIDGMNTYISDSYGVGLDNGDYRAFVDARGHAWPIRTDYAVRLAAGAADGYSRLGWRQLPISVGASNDDYIFTKKYDNTWYTMCFPWDMDDNTLFRAFNQDCEIAEFVGAEMLNVDDEATEDVIEYSLIFHFNKVAPTSYVTENWRTDGLVYQRLTNLTRTVEIDNNGSKATVKIYTYQDQNGNQVTIPQGLENTKLNAITDPTQHAMVKKYNSILHLLAKGGHPYMIHPSVGASPGNPADCTFAGVKKILTGESTDQVTYLYKSTDAMAKDNKVSWIATTGADFEDPDTKGGTFYNPYSNKTGDGSGYYTFIGNPSETAKDMLSEDYPIAYYLAAEKDNGGSNPYPKYYRKSGGGEGKWSPYTAIIRPEKNAQENIEALDGFVVTTNANRNVVFGEWETVNPTAIEEIIAEAEANNQEVKKVNLNVVYNVNGQVVRTNSVSVEGLPKGLYIVNGKKYMVQ